jgi:hypothetical protein
MRIPYCFLDEDHLPSGEPCFFEDAPGSGKYVIVLAQTVNTVNGYTFLRTGEDIAEARHNLWEALWSVFAQLPGRPYIQCPPESEWAPSENPDLFIEFDDSEGRAA